MTAALVAPDGRWTPEAAARLVEAEEALFGAGSSRLVEGLGVELRCPSCATASDTRRTALLSAHGFECVRGCSAEKVERGALALIEALDAREPSMNGSTPERGAEGLRVRAADLSRVRPIEWLWSRRLPLGYLSLLLGAEGIGKGVLSAWIIARATRGELPGDLEGRAARVLIVGDEDSSDSVILPRLYAAGADLGQVDTLHEDDDLLDVRRDAERLRELLSGGGYRLVYVDALLDVLAVDTDDWRSKPVRDALRPLRRIARDLELTVLGSLHPNKGQRSSFRDLISGTHAFNASSRSSLLLAEHPDDSDRRVLVRGKGNLSAPPPGLEFAIEGRDLEINGHGFGLPVVADVRDGELTIDDLMKPERPAPVRESLADQIDALGTGEVQALAEIARALGREPSDGSVRRALDQLEDQGRWQKEGRGQWRRLAIATSSEVAMCTLGGGDGVPGRATTEGQP